MASEPRVVGATIAGKYRIRRVVGAGSMGVVYEAEHIDIGKRVAIKLIDSSLAGLNDVAMRFRQEARAASLIESQHIVQVFDVGNDEKLGLYLVMEFLVGEDLAKTLARDERLPVETAVRIAVQVARGLARAHEAGVVHRDLKPANIFLCDGEDDQPHVKILDFGISKLIESSRARLTPALKLTRDGMVVGTPQYMSPEQAQGYSVDQRTDVWALGLVLYEMLAGRPAYPELPSYEQFIIHLVSEPPDPLCTVAPWIAEGLAGVVHAALEHDVTRRIPNCAELVRRLIDASSPTSGPTGIHTSPRGGPSPGDAPDTLVMSGRPRGVDRALDKADTAPDEARPSAADPPSSSSSGDGTSPAPPGRGQYQDESLAASGVRGAAREAVAVDDTEQDAPEFFDRKLIELFAPLPAAAAPGPLAAEPGGRTDDKPAVTPGPAGEEAPAPAGRWRLSWAGIVLVALGLLVAAALAWR